jgi:hypothetical protein
MALQVSGLGQRDQLGVVQSYNETRPHDALGGLPPAVYREQSTSRNLHLSMSG